MTLLFDTARALLRDREFVLLLSLMPLAYVLACCLAALGD
jgi:hypothetical protein